MARAAGGTFLLRIEDTDLERSKPKWIDQIEEDLSWLGLSWPKPVLRQSQHLERYQKSIDALAARALLFPCSCTRADIRSALAAPQEGVANPPYPGTCRHKPMTAYRPENALRLNLDKALAALGPNLPSFTETGPRHSGTHLLNVDQLHKNAGDIVVGRKDGIVAYFLASALDDIEEGITHVVRGEDLFEFTAIQVLLLTLLGHKPPIYHHHPVIRDDQGKRLAKRDDARAIAKYRADDLTPADIRARLGL